MLPENKRKERRVTFARGVDVHIMAIDGTWRRVCVMHDVSATGAMLTTMSPIAGLNLSEFFLLLSTTGLAYRRCSLAWINGDQIGVSFHIVPQSKGNLSDAAR